MKTRTILSQSDRRSLMEVQDAVNLFPRPKGLAGSFKAKEDVVGLILEWERIDGGDYQTASRKAAYMRVLPEANHKKFQSDITVDSGKIAMLDLEHKIDVYVRNNTGGKGKDSHALGSPNDKAKRTAMPTIPFLEILEMELAEVGVNGRHLETSMPL